MPQQQLLKMLILPQHQPTRRLDGMTYNSLARECRSLSRCKTLLQGTPSGRTSTLPPHLTHSCTCCATEPPPTCQIQGKTLNQWGNSFYPTSIPEVNVPSPSGTCIRDRSLVAAHGAKEAGQLRTSHSLLYTLLLPAYAYALHPTQQQGYKKTAARTTQSSTETLCLVEPL